MKLEIKQILKQKGVTQVELAKRLNMSKIGVNLIVNNKNTPSIDTLERIAEILDVPVGNMLSGDLVSKSFSAIINDNGKAYVINSPEELKAIAARFS